MTKEKNSIPPNKAAVGYAATIVHGEAVARGEEVLHDVEAAARHRAEERGVAGNLLPEAGDDERREGARQPLVVANSCLAQDFDDDAGDALR